jgi:wyosine [tRNA(Phe)-imidazoG37] synthetase (radical SAM superfamily)
MVVYRDLISLPLQYTLLPMQYSHIFGPVSSRRLGRSLGVDLVPCKTCPYDCVYCECGATTSKTTKRCEFFPVDEVLDELSDYLSGAPHLDFITFSGAGEPTLSLSLGEVISFLKNRFPRYRVAVLTGGSLLCDPRVREELSRADVVLPTLSSVIGQTFQKIHRPDDELTVNKLLEGLIAFRKGYQGEIWLEVFIIHGLNTSDTELDGLKTAIPAIHPDRIQLNTLDRTGTESWVLPTDPRELERIRKYLGFSNIETIKSQPQEFP